MPSLCTRLIIGVTILLINVASCYAMILFQDWQEKPGAPKALYYRLYNQDAEQKKLPIVVFLKALSMRKSYESLETQKVIITKKLQDGFLIKHVGYFHQNHGIIHLFGTNSSLKINNITDIREMIHSPDFGHSGPRPLELTSYEDSKFLVEMARFFLEQKIPEFVLYKIQQGDKLTDIAFKLD